MKNGILLYVLVVKVIFLLMIKKRVIPLNKFKFGALALAGAIAITGVGFAAGSPSVKGLIESHSNKEIIWMNKAEITNILELFEKSGARNDLDTMFEKPYHMDDVFSIVADNNNQLTLGCFYNLGAKVVVCLMDKDGNYTLHTAFIQENASISIITPTLKAGNVYYAFVLSDA